MQTFWNFASNLNWGFWRCRDVFCRICEVGVRAFKVHFSGQRGRHSRHQQRPPGRTYTRELLGRGWLLPSRRDSGPAVTEGDMKTELLSKHTVSGSQPSLLQARRVPASFLSWRWWPARVTGRVFTSGKLAGPCQDLPAPSPWKRVAHQLPARHWLSRSPKSPAGAGELLAEGIVWSSNLDVGRGAVPLCVHRCSGRWEPATANSQRAQAGACRGGVRCTCRERRTWTRSQASPARAAQDLSGRTAALLSAPGKKQTIQGHWSKYWGSPTSPGCTTMGQPIWKFQGIE